MARSAVSTYHPEFFYGSAYERCSDIQSTNDYYPFGSPLPGRGFDGGSYKFGFNGQEKVDEVSGEGNTYDFGARIYDARAGRWMSIDPLTSRGPYWSPYSAFANNPISTIDDDGKWPGPVHAKIIRDAFAPLVKAGKVTAKQVEYMIQGSMNADAIPNQTVDKSYIHSMRAQGQKQFDAEKKRDVFIRKNEQTFAELADFSETEGDAWSALGAAMHPGMDEIAPSHAEKDLDGVVWFKANDLGYDPKKWIAHGSAEKEISPEQKKAAMDNVLQTYYDALEMKNNTNSDTKNASKQKAISAKEKFKKKTENTKTVIIGRCL